MTRPAAPPTNCDLCPRLREFREENRAAEPEWFNAPVPGFGDPEARIVIVGLAPGLKGANRTGRPFTGDYAGDLLYATLRKFGLATGAYKARADDGFRLRDTFITNAVKCVPPQNKPVGLEIKTCRRFLAADLMALSRWRVLLALGRIAHNSLVAMLDRRQKDFAFGHGHVHGLDGRRWLVDSYHCSRYNTNTKRLTEAMFEGVFETIIERLDQLER